MKSSSQPDIYFEEIFALTRTKKKIYSLIITFGYVGRLHIFTIGIQVHVNINIHNSLTKKVFQMTLHLTSVLSIYERMDNKI